MDKNIIMAVVLGALVVVAALQAFQLFGLKTQLSSGTATVQTQTTTTPTQTGGSGSSGNLPSNLQNLPSMVGGC